MNYKFQTKGWKKQIREIIYQEEITNDTEYRVISDSCLFEGNDLRSLLSKLENFVGNTSHKQVILNSKNIDGRIDICILLDKNGDTVSESDISKWEKHKFRIWEYRYVFQLQVAQYLDIKITKEILRSNKYDLT